MKREIKFRAWDKKNAQMLHKISVGDGGDHVWVPEDEVQVMTSTMHYEDADTGYWLLSGFQLMQYTGLKDKNGKEIYEGDIVRYCEDMFRGDIIQEVKFSEGRFIPLVRVKEGYNSIARHSNDMFEVIGNIYENPELLEQKPE